MERIDSAIRVLQLVRKHYSVITNNVEPRYNYILKFAQTQWLWSGFLIKPWFFGRHEKWAKEPVFYYSGRVQVHFYFTRWIKLWEILFCGYQSLASALQTRNLNMSQRRPWFHGNMSETSLHQNFYWNCFLHHVFSSLQTFSCKFLLNK